MSSWESGTDHSGRDAAPSADDALPEKPVRDPPSAANRRPRTWASVTGTVGRVAGTLFLLAFALRNVEWSTLASDLRSADWRWWMAGLTAGVIVQVVAAVRWGSLARPIGFPLSTATFIRRFFEGAFFSLCLPGSIGGDVVKAFRLSDTVDGRLLAGCTILADRMTGLTALLVLAFTALVSQHYTLSVTATIAVGAALLLLAMTGAYLGVRMIDRVISRLPEHHRVKRFLAYLLPYQVRPSLLVRALAWSMVVQMGGAFAVSLVGRSVGIELPLAVWFGSVPLVAVAMVLPISISGVGVREGGLSLLLKPHGVAPEQAVAIGVLWFLTTIVCGLLGGVSFLAERRPATISLPQALQSTASPPG